MSERQSKLQRGRLTGSQSDRMSDIQSKLQSGRQSKLQPE